jgi:hypothetical protein
VEAQQIILQQSTKTNLTSTNWTMSLNLGAYGRSYLLRAVVAYSGLGANLYKDAVYAGAFEDSTGQRLNGAHGYTLHFDEGQFPPVDPRAFWSVTLYNSPAENLFDNPIGRNGLGIPTVQNNSLVPNPDGSLTFYIQADAPTDPNEYSNWLPCPPGDFILLLRMYMPTHKLFQQTDPWVPQAVQRVD